MSLRVGELHALLKLDSREFEQGLRRGEQQMRTFGQRVEQMIQRSQEFESATRRVGLALTGLVGSLMLATHRATAYADSIDTVHQQTGIAIRTVEGLAYAAQQSNADFETLGIGLRAFARRVAEAAQGNEQFLQWFERLGISQQHLQENLDDLESLFMLVSDRMAGLSTEAEAASVAMGLMSDAGRRLTPFLRQGSAGIQELARQFDAMGAATDERAIKALAQLGSEIDATRALFSAAGRQIVIDFLPAIQQVHDRIRSLAQAFLSLDQEQRQQIVRWAGLTAGVMSSVTALGLLVGVLGRVGRGLMLLATAVRRNPLVFLGLAAGGLVLSLEEVRQKLNEIARQLGFGPLLDEFEALQQAFESMIDFEAPDDANLKVREMYRDLLEEARRALEEGRVGLEGEIEATAERIRATLQDAIQDITRERAVVDLARIVGAEDAGAVLEAQMRLLQRELDAHLEALVDLKPHAGQLGDEYLNLRDRAYELVRAIKELGQEQESLAEAERRAADEAARQSRIMDAFERFRRLEHGEMQRLERLLATARGDVAVELTVQEMAVREIESVIADFIREGLESGVFAFDVAIEQLERQSARLREIQLDERLREIAREAERSLGPMLEFRELMAAITGEEFDPALFELRVLEQQILSTASAMFGAGKSMDEIREATSDLVNAYYDAAQRVRQTAEEEALLHEDLVESINWVNIALDGMARGLDKNQRALAEFLQALRWEGGGLVFRPEGIVGSIFSFVGTIIGDLLGGGTTYRGRGFEPRPMEVGSGWAVGVRGLLEDIRKAEQELARRIENERRAEQQLREVRGHWWNPSVRQRRTANLEEARRLVHEGRKALEDIQDAVQEFLAIDVASISQAVERGFEQADIARALEGNIRTALIRAWATSDVMLTINKEFSKQIHDLVMQYLETGMLAPGDLDPLRKTIDDIAQRGDAFRRVMDELGLAVEGVTGSFASLSRNLPRGFRVERYRFEATFGTPPIPSYADGGYVPATPGGRIVRVAEGGEGEYIIPESRMGAGAGGFSVVIQRMYVHDGRDFGRRLDQELRRRGLVQTGNPMGGRGRL